MIIACIGLPAEEHRVGKQNTQEIERKNLNGRTWIKRLARKTLCFSKLEAIHQDDRGVHQGNCLDKTLVCVGGNVRAMDDL